MKPIIQDIITAFIMGFVVPALTLGGSFTLSHAAQPPVSRDPAATVPTVSGSGHEVAVMLPSGEIIQTDSDLYLTGVVLAEMPAEFEPEALKAQAVAARTYTCKASVTGGKHSRGCVCTESSCCQAYISAEDYLALGGKPEHYEKVRSAVSDTSGVVLTYEGELIEATYFSCSGGSTEDAQAVWGNAFPYLVSVDSPEEEAAEAFSQTLVFSPEAFGNALGIHPEGHPESWFGLTSYTNGGGVDFMYIADTRYDGTQLRSLLGLRSTAFAIEVADGKIHITTKGYGHRVGMSQYGAEAMAVNGSTYAQILQHYYPGTQLVHLDDLT